MGEEDDDLRIGADMGQEPSDFDEIMFCIGTFLGIRIDGR
jgi:hypothetical protein